MNQSTKDSQNSTRSTIFISSQRRDVALLLLILGLGLTVRGLFIFLSDHRLASDELEYHSLAASLVEDGVYAIDGKPTAYRPVGYPLFVASVYAFVGSSPLAVRFIQALLDVMIGLVLFRLASRYSKRSGFVAAGIWMIYVPAVLYANRLLSETFFTFLLILVALVATTGKPRGLTSWLLVGPLFALLTLIKPWMILFVAFWYAHSVRLNTPPKTIVLSALLFFSLIAPWIVRNAIQFGVPTLSLNSGINLYIGNNPRSTGAYKGVFPHELLRHSHDEVALDRNARSMAFAYLLEHPEKFVTNGLKKIGHLFASEGELLVFTFSKNDFSQPRRYAKEYTDLPISLIAMANIPYVLILLTGMIGFVVSQKDPLWSFTAGIVLITVVVSVVFFGGSRFHFPFMPFLTIFASSFLTKVISIRKEITRSQRVVIVILSIAFGSIWLYEIVFLASV